jgi:transposase
LGLEEAEQIEAAGQAESEEAASAERKTRAARRRANRGALPAHLPRIETVVDVASMIGPGCSGTLHRIGEDVAERLDIVPAQFRVLVVRRPKYACRTCEDVVVQAAAPARLIEGGLPTEASVAQVLVSKYADDLPLELIRELTPSLAHSTPSCSTWSLAKVSTISGEPQAV